MVVPRDKNINKLFIMCPVAFKQALDSMFVYNTENYVVVNDTVEYVYDKLFKGLKELCAERDKFKGLLNDTKLLPYGYVLPKDKDTNRNRPVVSYFPHPGKKVYNRAGRILTEMIKVIDKDKHFILWKTGDLKEVIEEKRKQTRFKGGKWELYVKAYDIKDFYTMLRHGEIRKAILWLFELFRKKKGWAKVFGVSKDEVKFRSRSMKSNGWTWWDFDILFETIMFDLDNTFFTVGDVILKQEKGVPVGSPLSPPLAILVAAYYECMFLESIPEKDRKKIEGIRYVDDILIFGFVDIECDRERFLTAKLIEKFAKECYHADLTLEEEEIKDNKVIFLEAELIIFGDKIEVSHKNKNWNLMQQREEQNIFRFVRWNSAVPRCIKKAVVIGAIHRILVHSTNTKYAVISILKILFELNVIGFPWVFLRRVIIYFYQKNGIFIKALDYVYKIVCICVNFTC